MKIHSYALPVGYFITDLSIDDTGITTLDFDQQVPVSIQTTGHPDNLPVYQKFVTEKNNASKDDQWMH